MKQGILLMFLSVCMYATLQAQKKDQPATGYAITGSEKGNHNWKDVRLIDMKTGEEIKRIYSPAGDAVALNARTGKPVQKKPLSTSAASRIVNGKKVVSLDDELSKSQNSTRLMFRETVSLNSDEKNAVANGNSDSRRLIVYQIAGFERSSSDKPFSTNSAAMAYDRKHERLYYTPMNINELRYIDLKSKTPVVYFFEDEAFGEMKPGVDVGKQITRMVIASDGNGYALTNDAKSLIKFTTGKQPKITDLGSLVDDPANGSNSVHGRQGFGGDLIADGKKNLYLITANRKVFRINIESKSATFLGEIKGLPAGFQTNGALVEGGSKVIVCSSQSTDGYYRFDLNTFESEKLGSGKVFNASDLANGNLAFEKSKKEKKQKPETTEESKAPVIADEAAAKKAVNDLPASNGISVYPNPVTDGLVKLSFNDQPSGQYQVQLLDLSGRVISNQQYFVTGARQVLEFRLPSSVSAGNYYLKITSEVNKVSSMNKLVVQ